MVRARPWNGSGSGAVGKHDRDLSRRRPLDEIESEFAARAAAETRAEPIRHLFGEGAGVSGLRDEPDCRLGELAIGNAFAETHVHVRGESV